MWQTISLTARNILDTGYLTERPVHDVLLISLANPSNRATPPEGTIDRDRPLTFTVANMDEYSRRALYQFST